MSIRSDRTPVTARIPWARELLQSADRLAMAVHHADQSLLEDEIRERAKDYLALRQEWTKTR
jgi:hypothetical protein